MNKEKLLNLYLIKKKSAAEIAHIYGYSNSKVNYWLQKYKIPKRSISEGVYIKVNPTGDPFRFTFPVNRKQAILFGVGIGLFWGEGNKKNMNSVRLGNTDPFLIKAFLVFLTVIYKVDRRKIRFGLQTFNDIDPQKALDFWQRFLGYSKKHFFPTVIVSKIRGKGTYSKKSKHGVLTVYVGNTKLKKLFSDTIENIDKII